MAASAYAADPLLEINQRLANTAKLYQQLRQPAAHHVEANYEIVSKMQIEADEVDRLAAWELSPAAAAAALNDLLRLHHGYMACAAVMIGDDQLFELHVAIALHRSEQVLGFTGGRAPIPPDPCDYAGLSAERAARRNAWRPVKLVLDRSPGIVDLKRFAIVALPESGAARAPDDAVFFAAALDRRLDNPIVRNWFLSDFAEEAVKQKLSLEDGDYFREDASKVALTQWIADKRRQIDGRQLIELVKVPIPAGRYYVYPRGAAVAAPQPNFIVGEQGSDRAPSSCQFAMVPSATEVTVDCRYETGGGLEQGAGKAKRRLMPQFQLLDLRLATNSQTRALEGAVGGRIFQSFGAHVGLQAQAQLNFVKERDRANLERLFPTFGPGQTLVSRDQRQLVDSSGSEFQVDIGPVLHYRGWQVAAIQSLEYVKRGSFERGGLIGQWFFNAGHVFSWGQIGLFATRANFDEPVVKTVPFETALFEETYLKVSNQAGINLQVKVGTHGYLEGTLGYLDTSWMKRAGTGMVRYVRPLRDKFAATAEVRYDEGFIRNGANPVRVSVGLRLGHWPSAPPAAIGGPVPVVVPRIHYETATRIVQRGKRKPVANAGADQLGVDWTKGPIRLDGSRSYDPDGEKLSYRWTQTKGPAVNLSNAGTATPFFTGANAAEYVFQLVVAAGGVSSDPASVAVTTLKIDKPQILFFTANPPEVQPGKCSVLQWDTRNAESLTLRNLTANDSPVDVPSQGTRQVCPSETANYLLKATNTSGETDQSLTVRIEAGSLPQIVFFTADPPEIQAGKCAVLQWDARNADAVTLRTVTTGDAVAVAAQGSRQVCPPQTTNYALTARNVAGEVGQTVTVRIVPGPVPKIAFFTATPTDLQPGKCSTLQWSISDAETVTLRNLTTGEASLVPAQGGQQVCPAQTTSYVLTAKNQFGEDNWTLAVRVIACGVPDIGKFAVSPDVITRGETATLAWQVQNATGIAISGLAGILEPTGTRTVAPLDTTQYTLTATNTCGSSTKTVQLTVTKPVRVLSFTANPGRTAKPGDPVTLAWTTQDATQVVISGVPAPLPLNGSVTVNPSADTVYTLIANGDRSQAQAIVLVRVGGP